jgi:hypothetical protein
MPPFLRVRRVRGNDGSRTSYGLEEFDRIAVGIQNLDLLSTGSADDGVPKRNAAIVQNGDGAFQIIDGQHQSIPSAGFLLLAVWKRTRTRPRPGIMLRITRPGH